MVAEKGTLIKQLQGKAGVTAEEAEQIVDLVVNSQRVAIEDDFNNPRPGRHFMTTTVDVTADKSHNTAKGD